jgi:hypothetical protein
MTEFPLQEKAGTLSQMRDVMAKGWCQGYLAISEEGPTDPTNKKARWFDPIGAYIKVEGPHVKIHEDKFLEALFLELETTLVEREEILEDHLDRPGEKVIAWNDRNGTTKDMVLAVFDATIRRLGGDMDEKEKFLCVCFGEAHLCATLDNAMERAKEVFQEDCEWIDKANAAVCEVDIRVFKVGEAVALPFDEWKAEYDVEAEDEEKMYEGAEYTQYKALRAKFEKRYQEEHAKG